MGDHKLQNIGDEITIKTIVQRFNINELDTLQILMGK